MACSQWKNWCKKIIILLYISWEPIICVHIWSYVSVYCIFLIFFRIYLTTEEMNQFPEFPFAEELCLYNHEYKLHLKSHEFTQSSFWELTSSISLSCHWECCGCILHNIDKCLRRFPLLSRILRVMRTMGQTLHVPPWAIKWNSHPSRKIWWYFN